jgi:hypothetical protein
MSCGPSDKNWQTHEHSDFMESRTITTNQGNITEEIVIKHNDSHVQARMVNCIYDDQLGRYSLGFIVRIGDGKKETIDRIVNRIGDSDVIIKTLSFGKEKQFKLITPSGQEYSCNQYFFENSHGVVPYISLLSGFNIPKIEEGSYSLIYSDFITDSTTFSFPFSSRYFIPKNDRQHEKS